MTSKTDKSPEGQEEKKSLGGAIAWMTVNPVAANLLMLVLIIGGAVFAMRIKQEVFPEFDLDTVSISVPYPGASPAEVEQGIVFVLEEAVRGLDGVKRVTATAAENVGSVAVELHTSTDANKALADVKNAVDRITSFPEDAEKPLVSLLTNRHDVISVALYGDQTEEVLRQIAETVRSDLLAFSDITYVELSGVRPREISIEVPQGNLRKYSVTLSQIAHTVARSSVELPGGVVKTKSGQILLRTAERRDLGEEFGDIPLLSPTDGGELRVKDVGKVIDGFSDTDESAEFNGKPAVMIQVFRSGEQTPIEVADAVHEYVARKKSDLPPGISVATLNDRSEMYSDRMDLLLRNGRLGLLLVLIILGLFLEARLSFWVTLGIPISFLGSMLLMPLFDVSLNMVSLFAFIICLGIVVDDAIVVGENIHEARERGLSQLDAAIQGAKRIAMPVIFSVLTTVTAFLPLFFVPGFMGKIFRVIAAVVVCVLAISLIESLLVLPAHLAHRSTVIGVIGRFFRWLGALYGRKPDPKPSRLLAQLNRFHDAFTRGVSHFTNQHYGRLLTAALRNRVLTLAIGVALLVATLGYVKSGRIEFNFMPKVDGDVIIAYLTLPYGVPLEETEALQTRLLVVANELIEEHGGERIKRGVYSQLGSKFSTRGHSSSRSGSGGHLANVAVFLVPSDQREISAQMFAKKWRARVGDLPGIESLTFRYSTGPGAGEAINIEVSHEDMEVLQRASADLAGRLSTFDGVRDIDDGFAEGKPQLDFRLKPEARSLGITAAELGRQVRSAFFGAEALRQQRGRDEIRVMVRLPEAERSSEFNVEELLLRTTDGGEVPLAMAAGVTRGKSYTQIRRADGRRVVNVTGDVPKDASGRLVANPRKIQALIKKDVIPELKATYPGLAFAFEGNARHRTESLDSLVVGYYIALIVIFALLAIPFKSYVQPIVVMFAIPFGLVGAVVGHVIMGYNLSIISGAGLIAVSGIVVNDSLVLVHAANKARDNGQSATDAIHWAGRRRFRPIILTSLTTFFGLTPMIFETAVSARFLVPMAISLGFGVLFATGIILLIVPSVYVMVEDARAAVLGFRSKRSAPATAMRLDSSDTSR